MKKKLMALGITLMMTVTSVLGGRLEARAEQAEGMGGTVSAELVAGESMTVQPMTVQSMTVQSMTVQPITVQLMESTDMLQHVTRVAGNDRYETAIQCAELMRGENGFRRAVIASADNFPDALAGSYLAGRYDAPILLAGKSEAGTQKTLDYIKEHIEKGRTIYLLGGTGAVPESVEQALGDYGVVRLAGATRYETNLAIINEVPEKPECVIIASGKSYADSLSVSAYSASEDMPIILAGDALTEEAIETIKAIEPLEIYIIGGTGAVNETVEAQAKELCGTVERIAGMDRYVTSLAIAEYFGGSFFSSTAVFAYGGNFPDGLTGGVLAGSLYAPVILVSDSNYEAQEAFVKENWIAETYVMGGTSAVSDETMAHLAGMGEKEEEPDTRVTIIIEYYLNGNEEPRSRTQYKVEPGTVVNTATYDERYMKDFIESPYATIEGETFTVSAADDWTTKRVYITAEMVHIEVDVYLDGEFLFTNGYTKPRGILIDTLKLEGEHLAEKWNVQSETFIAEEGARGSLYLITIQQE